MGKLREFIDAQNAQFNNQDHAETPEVKLTPQDLSPLNFSARFPAEEEAYQLAYDKYLDFKKKNDKMRADHYATVILGKAIGRDAEGRKIPVDKTELQKWYHIHS